MTDDLLRWALLFRRVGSTAVADLLGTAAYKIAAGETDDLLASELAICAAMREHLPEQRTVAFLMKKASVYLLSSRVVPAPPEE